MRIFYAAGASPNAYDIGHSELWKRNLFDSLVAMGHEVIPFSMDVTAHFTRYRNFKTAPAERAKFMAYREELQEALLRYIAAAHAARPVELFFSYFWSEIAEPATIDRIRELGITTVNWYCNGSYQFDLVAQLAPHYDWCLVPEKFRLAGYRAAGARPLYCQEAANPAVYHPFDVEREFDVTFVGQAYGERPAYVRHLLDSGIDVRVWGYGWERFVPGAGEKAAMSPLEKAGRMGRKLLTAEGRTEAARRFRTFLRGGGSPVVELPAEIAGGVLSDEEMIRMYSRSKINLGFSTCGDTHAGGERIVQVRLRDFEVPMSGGFYMVEYMEELEEFFAIGKEVVCYEGPEDLAEKIRYYLSHDAEREAIRRAGHERCLRDHTWQRRFEAAFREMGLA